MSSDFIANLPNADELPYSDGEPLDNEDQNLLPNLLLFQLSDLWSQRHDWFLGVNMGIYHTTGKDPRIPVIPNAFLSLNVERRKGGKFRQSYAVWEENWQVPVFVLEMVSHIHDDEYGEKKDIYAKLGVLYYVVYNPEFWQRDHCPPFEVYKLIDGEYHLQISEPCWMPEVGLGIGRSQQLYGGMEQEILTWFDQNDRAHLSFWTTPCDPQPRLTLAKKRVQQANALIKLIEQEAKLAQQKAEKLAVYLRSQGLDPDNLPEL